jgi:hypothetical protein
LDGVWDDSKGDWPSSAGGQCLTSWQAKRMLASGKGPLEEIRVNISKDEHLTGADGLSCRSCEFPL